MLATEIERESSARDIRYLMSALSSQATGMAAVAEVANAIAQDGDPLAETTRAAQLIGNANIAFLLERRGKKYVSVASAGMENESVKITPQEHGTEALGLREAYFIGDVRGHPGLDPVLISGLRAKSLLFEPIIRENDVIAVLLLIWREPHDALPPTVRSSLRLLTAQASLAITHVGLKRRLEELALSDPLTGVASARIWDEHLVREVARASRHHAPVSVAFIEVDLDRFQMLHSEAEMDRMLKEATTLAVAESRSIDLLARLTNSRFGVLLPNCG